MTYLQLVNKVLIRLRENEVSSVQETPYSKLIGEFVNVVKREVEDAYNWSTLRTTITANTVAGVHSYTLTGSTTRCRFIDVYNDTDNTEMFYQTTRWFDKQFQGSVPTEGSPYNYNPNGVSADGDHIVDVYPVPDGGYSLRFNIVKPQADLEADGDVILVPYQLVIEGALARAISERGDDGGYSEQEMRYNRVLGDYISNEAGLRPEETTWYLA
jgi:hypothetical protein